MKKQSIQSGFSLVEMMVAIAIFMVVAVVAVSALLKIVDADRKSKTLQDTVNNINFAMDSITREIRVGSAYTCGSGSTGYQGSIPQTSQGISCSATQSNPNNNSGVYIAFLSSNIDPNHTPACNLAYSYYFQPVPVPGGTYTWTIEKAQESSCGSGLSAYYPIIDRSIIITAYSIKVVEGNPLVQPSVFIYISGYTGKTDKTKTYFDLQTTISERI